jgi:5-(carboxyamino)imidazole ribonucleotide synthase
MKRIGILGGGQLGKMLAESVYKLGGTVSIYDPDANAPAKDLAGRFFNCSWTDEESLAEFFRESDVFTYEFENVESAGIAKFENTKPILPSVSVLQTTQDRLKEKQFLRSNSLPHAAFLEITSVSALRQGVKHFGFPCVLKSTRGGYDGKGQVFIGNENDLEKAAQWIEKAGAEFHTVLEEALDLALEVSCIVGRDAQSAEIVFPVFENEHRNHILDLTIVPARIPPALAVEIQNLSLKAARLLAVKGLLTTEFFLSRAAPRRSTAKDVDGWYIYINEFAPRPHNSGHVTRNACTASQFDILARILMDVPFCEPKILTTGTYCLGNLLGDVWLSQGTAGADLDLRAWKNNPSIIDVVLYGKHEARSGRKMGHFVSYGDTAYDAVQSARAFREQLSQPSSRGRV